MKIQSWLRVCRRADPKHAVLLLMFVLYPLLVAPLDKVFYGQHQDYFAAPRYALLALVSLYALVLLLTGRGGPGRGVLLPLAGFFIFALTSALLAAYPVTAWVGAPFRYTGLSTYIFCLLLFLLTFRFADGPRLLLPAVAAAGVVSLAALLQAAGYNPVPLESFHQGMRIYGTLGSPDNYGVYAALMLPAAVYLYLVRQRLLWLAATTLICAGLLASFTWGAWAGALAGIVALFLHTYNPENKGPWLRVAGVIFGVALVFAAITVFLDLAQVVGVADPVHQYALAQKILHFIPLVWAFGLGPDHLEHVVRQMPLAGLSSKAPGLYLETAVTLGVPALVFYLFFIGRVLWRGRGVFLAMAVAYLVQGLFHAEVVQLMPLFWIILGLLASGDGAAGLTSAGRDGPGESAAGGEMDRALP